MCAVKTNIRGLIVWASSNCRSMTGLYHELKEALGVDVVVALWRYKKCAGEVTAREALGFDSNEFSDLKMVPVGEDWSRGIALLDAHKGYRHLFAAYQSVPIYRKLLMEAVRRGERVGVISESPCNSSRGVRRFIKEYIYLPLFVRRAVKDVTKAAEFILNMSGDCANGLRALGWSGHKILPFGYYPPPLRGSSIYARQSNQSFHILVTGIMEWRRAPDTILRALDLLKQWGVPYKASITQDGPMCEKLKRFAARRELPIVFTGFLEMADLIRLYQNCSVYVAAGRCEPWGIRLNDALNCGAPLIVSRGMGGVKLIDDYQCGLSFEANDYVDLAYKLRLMAENNDVYMRCSKAAQSATLQISPRIQVQKMVSLIRASAPGWI